MLRLLAILAGLVLLALLVFVFRQERVAAPVSTPTDEALVHPEDPRADPLSSVGAVSRNPAAAPAAADANYVSIFGEVTREEDGTPVEGAVATFAYRYLSKGSDAELRKVPVDVDEHGHFEQLFSEPVQFSACLIEPIEIESPELTITRSKIRRADFLLVKRPLDVRVATRGVRVSLQVSTGLEITGRVFDVQTSESQAGALVLADVDFGLTLCTRTNSSGVFRMRGLDPALAQPGRDYVALNALAPDAFSSIDKLCVRAMAASHRPGSTIIPLPLSALQPTRIDIPVASGIRLAGRVIDFDGKPLAGARVFLRTPAQELAGDTDCPRFVTNPAGEFTLDGVTPRDGVELRARHPWKRGPSARIVIGSLSEDREGLELKLPESQLYRIDARDPNGVSLGGACWLCVRNSAGECRIDDMPEGSALRVYVPIGERSEVIVSYDSGGSFRPVVLRGRTTLEPLVKREEPETVILDLEP